MSIAADVVNPSIKPPGGTTSYNAALESFKSNFQSYSYLVERPLNSDVYFNTTKCQKFTDTSAYVAYWFWFSNLYPALFMDYIYSWGIYEILNGTAQTIAQDVIQNVDFSQVKSNDILIFSTDSDFLEPLSEKYWCGFIGFVDEFMNFNTIEGQGSQSITQYLTLPDFQIYTNVVIFRI